MVVRVIEAKEDKVTTADLIADLKKSTKVDYSGAIFTFEGIVRGKEENMNLEKLILTTPDREKTQAEIEKIVENAKIKYNEKQTRNDRKIENDTDFDYYETKKKFSFKLLCI